MTSGHGGLLRQPRQHKPSIPASTLEFHAILGAHHLHLDRCALGFMRHRKLLNMPQLSTAIGWIAAKFGASGH